MKKTFSIVILLLSFSSPFSCTSSGNEKKVSQLTVQEAAITKNVSVEEFNLLITNRKDAILLDVRTKGEVEKGRLENSMHLDFYAQDFKNQLAKLDRDKPVLVYCHSGRRYSNNSVGQYIGITGIYHFVH